MPSIVLNNNNNKILKFRDGNTNISYMRVAMAIKVATQLPY